MSETEIEFYGKMSKLDAKQLTPEQKVLRQRYQKRQIYKNNKEEILTKQKEYNKNNKERIKEYRETPNCKKSQTLSSWKERGMIETKEEFNRIYNLWLNQELCNACDILLTRTGNSCSTDACMDHCHTTHRFRHIICRSCNSHDNWMEYFC